MSKCSNCGAELPENSKFCTTCGTKVEQVAAAPVVEPAAEPVAEAAATETAATAAPVQEPVNSAYSVPVQPVAKEKKPVNKKLFIIIGAAVLALIMVIVVAVVISTPLNVLFWGGTTGNVWGDALFAATQSAGMPVFLGSLLDEVVVDVPDKIITLTIAFLVLKGLPTKLISMYNADEKIESLD